MTATFRDETARAMTLLAQDPRTLFLGQNVAYSGHALYDSMAGVPMGRRIEVPVAEDLQMGMSTGMALAGYVPVSCYPRLDFLVLAMNQLVNHLDKLAEMSRDGYRPRVIVRALLGHTRPLDPGPQHSQDHTGALAMLLRHTPVVRVEYAEDVVPVYRAALEREGPTVVVEAPHA